MDFTSILHGLYIVIRAVILCKYKYIIKALSLPVVNIDHKVVDRNDSIDCGIYF